MKRACLLVAPSWLGDSVMALPAVEAWQAAAPDHILWVLAKPQVAPLWHLHPAVNEVIEWMPGPTGMRQTVALLRTRQPAEAVILPGSFRAAWICYRARIPRRIGFPGHWRKLLLTEIRCPPSSARHQADEYLALIAPGRSRPSSPTLILPVTARLAAQALLATARAPLLGLLPGAARGPAKCWPPTHFVTLGQAWIAETGGGVVLFGGPAERALGAELSTAFGSDVLNIIGLTDLPTLATAMMTCAVIVANDSGGMHLAAAIGTPLVALYGATDPERTGPLSDRSRILQTPGPCTRAIRRHSAAAVTRLARLTPDLVLAAVRDLWQASATKNDHA